MKTRKNKTETRVSCRESSSVPSSRCASACSYLGGWGVVGRRFERGKCEGEKGVALGLDQNVG